MTQQEPYTIAPSWLLNIHLIAPLLFLVFLVDVAFFQSSLLPYMGIGTLLLPLYLLFFELPHIIASLLTFADRDYLEFYRSHLIFGIPALLVVIGGLFYVAPAATFALYIAATMYHVVRQQTGIASIFARAKGVWFHTWTGLLVAATTLVVFLVALPEVIAESAVARLSLLTLVLIVLSMVAGFLYGHTTKTKVGRLYIGATTAVVVMAYFFSVVGYIFFAFFVIRFVHDITAFTFYVVHDHNRNTFALKNSFYSFFRKMKVPFLVAVPLASVVIALLIRLGMSKTSIVMAVIVLFGFAHYYVEAIMWKRASLHRQQIKFS